MLFLLLVAGCPAGDAGEQTAARVETVAARPAGGDWIQPARLQYYLNDVIEVEYNLEHDVPSSPAWIALVPADTDSLLAGDNFSAQVEYTHIHDLPAGAVRFHARRNGEYLLRLFGARREDTVMAAQSKVLRIGPAQAEQPPRTPPYVTLSGVELPEKIVLRPGMVIAAYWMLAEPPGSDAWIGQVPTSCTSTAVADNLAVATARKPLNGKTMGPTRFSLEATGEFVFRLFSGEDAAATMLCQSEVFTVERSAPDQR
jgi:hypothetical protein